MGKNKQLKRLRRLAKQLPPEIETVKRPIRVTGEDLIKKDITEITVQGQKEKVDHKRTYIGSTEHQRRVNHADKLKQAYKAGKVKGVASYVEKYLVAKNAKP